MNLHAMARPGINTVNPDITGDWVASTGYTVDDEFKQVPSYATTTIKMQVQALTAGDLKHVEGLNIEGVKRAVYMYGNKQGVVRPDAKGGDLLKFSQMQGGPVQVWKVIGVIETWATSGGGWCKVAVVLQEDAP